MQDFLIKKSQKKVTKNEMKQVLIISDRELFVNNTRIVKYNLDGGGRDFPFLLIKWDQFSMIDPTFFKTVYLDGRHENNHHVQKKDVLLHFSNCFVIDFKDEVEFDITE